MSRPLPKFKTWRRILAEHHSVLYFGEKQDRISASNRGRHSFYDVGSRWIDKVGLTENDFRRSYICRSTTLKKWCDFQRDKILFSNVADVLHSQNAKLMTRS